MVIVLYQLPSFRKRLNCAQSFQRTSECSGELSAISRATAVAAYIILTLILGLILSHPRNKESWRWGKYIFPLIFIAIEFSKGDMRKGWHLLSPSKDERLEYRALIFTW